MTRENSRWIERRYLDNKPLCLIPICNNICKTFKNGKFRNYCKDHKFTDMGTFTNWQSLRETVLKRDNYKCVQCGDDKKEVLIKVKRKKIINWDQWLSGKEKAKYLITYEEQTKSNLEADHIKEVADGGSMWDINNLQTLCYKCHKIKTSLFNRKTSLEDKNTLTLGV